MDPVTAAIVGALSAGATKVGKTALVDAYQGLKGVIKNRFGDESKVSKAVDKAEAEPESATSKQALQKEVEASGAHLDPEVRKAAQKLQEAMAAQPGGVKTTQEALARYIIQSGKAPSTSNDSGKTA